MLVPSPLSGVKCTIRYFVSIQTIESFLTPAPGHIEHPTNWEHLFSLLFDTDIQVMGKTRLRSPLPLVQCYAMH